MTQKPGVMCLKSCQAVKVCLSLCPDPGGVRLQRDGAEPAGRAAVPERRAAGTHHLRPLPGRGGNLHVAGLTGGQAHQAAQ